MKIFKQIIKSVIKKPQSRQIPICVFSYHKVGTALLSKVFYDICEENKWNFELLMGKQTQLPAHADVIHFAHSLIKASNIATQFTGIHFIRDPRDVIVSGYLYHKRTSEKWCTNSDQRPKGPIQFPKVPYSQEHRSEEWKKRYLESLNGVSYQKNLLSLPQGEGLKFEIEHYGSWTIESMKDWDYNRENILEMKYEDVMSNYDESFRLMFQHFGFSESEIDISVKIASEHDLKRKPSDQLEKMKHVSSTKHTRWADYFEPEHKQLFIDKFGDILVTLGYEKNNSW